MIMELVGGRGAATPAVCEPRPNFWRVFASSLPLGLSPWASWNFLMAAVVVSSHLPFGVPENEPSFASACCISVIRSAPGTFCPFSQRLNFLETLLRCDFFAELDADDFPWEAVCGLAAADTPGPAVRSSIRARWVTFRIVVSSRRYFGYC